MPRMTRAKAAEVADALHVDPDAVLQAPSEVSDNDAKSQPRDQSEERPPLSELAPNSVDGSSSTEDSKQSLKRSTRGKKGGRKGAAKNKKADATPNGAFHVETTQDAPEVLPDARRYTPSPASDAATDNLMKHASFEGDIAQGIADPTRSSTPPGAAIRLTRSQLSMKSGRDLQPEPKSLVDGIGQTPEKMQAEAEEIKRSADIPAFQKGYSPHGAEGVAPTSIDAPASPLPSAMPNVVMSLRQETPAKRSTSDKENVAPLGSPTVNDNPEQPGQVSQYDALEHAVVEAATPPPSASHALPRPEDHIAAIDDLDDQLERASISIPDVQSSPESSKDAKQGSLEPDKENPGKAKKPAPVVRATKASQGRLSVSKGAVRVPSLGKPRPSSTLGRSNSGRQSVTKAASSKRPVGPGASKDLKSTSAERKKEPVIPHSKPRPISMSFPAPAPPPKSSKAPTQSNFKLPGESVAEKFKAQREARKALEAEEEAKRKAFKARPVPSSLRAAPSVRATNASKARESAVGASKDTTRTVSNASSGSAAAGDVRASRPRVTSKEAPPAKPHAPLAVRKRPSTAMASLLNRFDGGAMPPERSLSRATSGSRPVTSTSTNLSGSVASKATGTEKGKEVFNRAANANQAAEREKREKEEAAKNARAAAAERGRQASREWAEKQRLKKLAAKGGVSAGKGVNCGTEDGSGEVMGQDEATAAPMGGQGVELVEG